MLDAMTDLAILVPSRGRPGNVARLIAACERTCEADTVLHFGFDNDDPELPGNILAADGQNFTVHDRQGLTAWTNELASYYTATIPYLASLGDDMVPVTPGWDRLLIEAQQKLGGGFTYPDDKRRNDIPEAVVIDTRIVRALGWMCQPALSHWFIDSVWRDLGVQTGRLTYCSHVVVEHRHPNVKGSGTLPDSTYSDAAAGFSVDMAAYQKWRLKGMRADAERVRECLASPTG
jgi:hypothetical protein